MQEKMKQKAHRFHIINALSTEYLWAPTPAYFVAAGALFMLIRNKFRWRSIHFVPFCCLPVTADFVKREFYVMQFPEEKKAFI